jgi:hypothetical protein
VVAYNTFKFQKPVIKGKYLPDPFKFQFFGDSSYIFVSKFSLHVFTVKLYFKKKKLFGLNWKILLDFFKLDFREEIRTKRFTFFDLQC